MRHKQSQTVSTIAIFFAVMLVIHFVSSTIFNVLPVPIKPTLIHIPVIIASILYGPCIGASLGALMGIISVVTNTVIRLPTSYLFSPFVENGNVYSLVIAMVPRILIGITPYYIYKLWPSKPGTFLAGAIGSLTNTVFVLGGIFILFANVYNGDIQKLLAVVIGTNSVAEMLISAFFTGLAVPRLSRLRK
ncbi:ECF transporter S component [Streptococcus caprae]|uniref:ECF transporter S component n=1 Tax=Streptococcus caprae TaxID=1640501 RepID=A0ABV8CVB7_9STRE